jgi:hypothetical protein
MWCLIKANQLGASTKRCMGTHWSINMSPYPVQAAHTSGEAMTRRRCQLKRLTASLNTMMNERAKSRNKRATVRHTQCSKKGRWGQ